jgi:membrane protease YdiL (CAAX protease family)
MEHPLRQDHTPWGPPTGPAVGWHDGREGSRFFDGIVWSDPVRPTVPPRVGLSVLVVLGLSLLIARVSVVALEPVGVPVGVLVALLIVLGYVPPAWWAVRSVRRSAGSAWRAAIGWHMRPIDVAWGLLGWLAAVVVQSIVLVVLMAFDVPVASNAADLGGDSVPTWYLVATGLAAVIAAPLVEELVFRGVVQSSLVPRLGAPVAVLIQGAVFGAVHADPLFGWSNIGLWIVLGAVGAVFGAVAHFTGRIAAAVIAHAVFNGVVLIVLFTGLAPT